MDINGIQHGKYFNNFNSVLEHWINGKTVIFLVFSIKSHLSLWGLIILTHT